MDPPPQVGLVAVFDSLDYCSARFQGFLSEVSSSLPQKSRNQVLNVNIVIPHRRRPKPQPHLNPAYVG